MILCEGTKHYERCLDLETAICWTEFTVGDSIYEREIFASHPADCLVMRFRTRGKGKVNFLAKLRRESWFDGTCKVGENGIRLYGNLGRGGYEFAMELRAVSTGGQILTQGECLKAEGAERYENLPTDLRFERLRKGKQEDCRPHCRGFEIMNFSRHGTVSIPSISIQR